MMNSEESKKVKIEEEIVNYNIEKESVSNDIEEELGNTEGLETPVGNTSMFDIQDFMISSKKSYKGNAGKILIVAENERSVEVVDFSEIL